MNKRTFKKQVQNSITQAVDAVMNKIEQSENTEAEKFESKIGRLLDLFDEMMIKVNEAKILPDTKARKSHFSNLLKHFDTKMTDIINSK